MTDDQNQLRVRREANAVVDIFRMIREGRATWVASKALEVEIGRNPDTERRRDVAAMLAFANEVICPERAEMDRVENPLSWYRELP